MGVYNESGNLLGHVPIEMLSILGRLLNDYGELEAECIGSRFNAGEGKELEFPVYYRFIENKGYLKKLHEELKIIKNAGVVRRLSTINSFQLFI